MCVFCLCASLSKTQHCMGIYIPSLACLIEGSDRWSEGSSIEDQVFERSSRTSKDYLSRSMIRTISFDEVEGSTLSFDLLSFDTAYLSTVD
ncbi:hypothetical protein HanPSC8_Chr17g0773431 [Helianthus annuus]|nr:hypothetical protein HanPSC8_Chr17g0773431 [Helianthus annuus]